MIEFFVEWKVIEKFIYNICSHQKEDIFLYRNRIEQMGMRIRIRIIIIIIMITIRRVLYLGNIDRI